jgi:hypothetical protein
MNKNTEQTNTSLKKRYIDGKKHMKRCLTSYIIRELQTKTTMRYYYPPLQWPNSRT